MDNTFLHIRKNNLSNLTFHQIKDGTFSHDTFTKPTGGLWLTRQDITNNLANEWVEYLAWHPYITIYGHYLNADGCAMNCLLAKLKNKAKIFNLDSIEKLNYLQTKYPSPNLFSYEALSSDYDGIYINIAKFYRFPIYKTYMQFFAVNTLLLFNLNCIEYYYPGIITIDDLDEEFQFNCYHINLSKEKKEILPISLNYQILQTKIAQLLPSLITDKDTQQLITFINHKFSEEIAEIATENQVSQPQLVLSLVANLRKFK